MSTNANTEENTTSRPHILVVDDDATHRKMMELIADHLGISPQLSSNCSEAIQFLAQAMPESVPDLILMDWRMPGIDGCACAKRIRELTAAAHAHVPIIAVTALVMPGDREACLNAGMDDYLAKPFTIDELKLVMDKWLRRKSEPNAV